MAELSSCTNKDYIKQSTLDINVLVRSKSMWKSSSETLESPTNSNDMLPFSADDVTSESEFDEHPYSISKRLKVSKLKHCTKTGFQPKFSTNKASNIMSEDNEDSSSCWPSSSVNNQINKCLSKTRRKGSKCESKNAVMARLNRLKKKKYVADLEDRNAKLEVENEMLKKKLAKKLKEVSLLKRETVNLHSVIRNSTEIGSLLQCVQKNTNLHVTSSILRNGSIPEHHQHLHSKKSMSDSVTQTTIDEFRPTNYDEGTEHEFNLLNSETKSILTTTNPSCLTSENTLINEICDFNFGIDPSDNDLLYDLKGEVSPNFFFNTNSSSEAESKIKDAELVRCETPSKDIDVSISNNDFLFDDVGVCFHIANNRVSLEFCESCNHKAAVWNDKA